MQKTKARPLFNKRDPLALKRLLDRLLAEADGTLSTSVRGHLESARKAALDEFVRAESSSLGANGAGGTVGGGAS